MYGESLASLGPHGSKVWPRDKQQEGADSDGGRYIARGLETLLMSDKLFPLSGCSQPSLHSRPSTMACDRRQQAVASFVVTSALSLVYVILAILYATRNDQVTKVSERPGGQAWLHGDTWMDE
jgi:hypothetical protein